MPEERGGFLGVWVFVCATGKADAYFCQTLLSFDLELDSMVLLCPSNSEYSVMLLGQCVPVYNMGIEEGKG